MSSKKSLIIASAVIVLVVVALILARREDDELVDNSPSPTVSATLSASPFPSRTVVPTGTPSNHVVRLTQSGPTPKTITIRAGDSVSFINDANVEFWPASDPHPTHNLCPGFDAKRALKLGDGYTLTFSEKRTCTYHNHLNPSSTALQGTIIVQ